jgi:S-formylglutathione hydrolase FrmB
MHNKFFPANFHEGSRMRSQCGSWEKFAFVVIGCLAVLGTPWSQAKALEFQLSFPKAVSDAPFTGRVYVLLSKSQPTELPSGPNWFNPEPFFALDVRDWRPDTPLTLGGNAHGYPAPLTKLAKGNYWIQGVMDFNRGGRSFSAAEGNGYSQPIQQEVNPSSESTIKLKLDQVFHERRFQETDRIKLVELESKLLSAFEGQPVRLRAAVVLPTSFAQNSSKRYPVVYEIPGFGGTHFMASFAVARRATDAAGVEMLWVMLDPSCRLGHHVFADSDNNGPYGRALIEELIPFIEKKFRGLGVPAARFVTGHSSGGWSSLWLQITYPDVFGGVWSTAPDPVDFRDFQRVNIYKLGANIFVDENGRKRPVARRNGKPMIYYKPFSDLEAVMGHGGQLGSFEAVFSPRGADGKPRPLWDRATGQIDAETAKSWERYDIRLILERNWPMLAPKLAGKLHVYVGGDDNFYLEGAVLLLKESLAKLGSDARVEIFPGKDHSTLMDRSLRQRIAREMAEQFRRQELPSLQNRRTIKP